MDIEKFKMEELPLHGKIWQDISQLEKERCRIGKVDKDLELHRSSLRNRKMELRNKQHEKKISEAMFNFMAGISQPKTESLYFLKWLKIQLDTLSRRHLSKLREQYNECKNKQGNVNEMAKLDEQISRSSLGPEHFFRELGQIYERACCLPENDPTRLTVEHLPALCAQMLLDGFPVELVDGDTSNIPMKWISEVLTQLHRLVDSKSRILVMTVLGVQGTGKSTLLNTMFGVQFAVSSGRCTRGAFMLLIKVSEEFKSELKCDFIMVIDTEGLQSPELAALDTSYEHDNELATLVIGLSDITIINVAMGNNTEMKDILQIVVHAFLRTKEVGKKPRCLFVHQNVSDMSAHDRNMRDRKKLMEQLDEMTRAAAKMEKKVTYTKFTDVMEYDPDKDNYYIPGLWHGTPPMAPVNTGYNEAVYELKRSLIGSVQTSDEVKRNNAKDFLKWTVVLWDAVKYEKCLTKAEEFTKDCLTPAVEDYITKRLGCDIADEMMTGDVGLDFSTRTHFQFAILKQLLDEDTFEKFQKYTDNYKTFVNEWILVRIIETFSQNDKWQKLKLKHLSEVVQKIKDATTQAKEEIEENTDMKKFIQKIRAHLEDQLIFQENDFVIILNKADTQQFADNLIYFLLKMEQSLTKEYNSPTSQDDLQEAIRHLPFKPHELLFNRLYGCGHQCPFCGTPCEAGGGGHTQHYSNMHRSKGLGRYICEYSNKLVTDICTTAVTTDKSFKSSKTKGEWHPYKKYREIYPDWEINGDASVEASDYWKYVMMTYNDKFAYSYSALPADIPKTWKELTKAHAKISLNKSFNIVEYKAEAD
ncbi:interferon-induced very large GTPase 1-like [Sardina pilchardus]|uniref:interferon-induced very large GTPase 1-like n=1 Tax=Sardina pilchardus TaxID=27697 RepID=UPI002E1371C2